jgi:pimeloyl-ACP methyl ester carboxylesterase
VRERDVLLPDGRTLHAYATEGDDAAPAILWHHDPQFTAGDLAVLAGEWSWFETILAPGTPGLVDDDIAYISPWGADPATVDQPVLFLHGEADGIAPPSHARWLASRLPAVELRLMPGDGHLSALAHAPDALAWLAARSA